MKLIVKVIANFDETVNQETKFCDFTLENLVMVSSTLSLSYVYALFSYCIITRRQILSQSFSLMSRFGNRKSTTDTENKKQKKTLDDSKNRTEKRP